MNQKWFTLGVAVSLSAATFAKPIGSDMDQLWRAHGKDVTIDTRFGLDPTRSAKVTSWTSKTPWTGSWWWTQSGSVAVRWRTSLYFNKQNSQLLWPRWNKSDAMTYETYSADELAKMSELEIRNSLSPIEKLDVAAGHANAGSSDYYKNLREVRAWVRGVVETVPDQLGFHGLCHGYSHAAIQLPEPNEVTVPVEYTLSDGRNVTIRVNFGSGDLKALASYYYGQKTFTANEYQAGFVGENDRGVNPAEVHLLLMNLLKEHDQSFVIDTEPGSAVWNYPVSGFESVTNRSGALTSSDADPRAVKQVYVTTDIYYMGTSTPTQTAWGVEAEERLFTKSYSYVLELTASDEVVGGSWAAGSDRVDFAWTLKGPIPFRGDYAFLTKYWK